MYFNTYQGLVLLCLAFTCVLVSSKPQKLKKVTQDSTKKVKLTKAARYLLKYGYIGNDFDVSNPEEEKMKADLTNFQHFAHIPQTGRLDAATIQMMSKSRCGMRDPAIKVTFRRSKRWTLQGNKWDFKDNPGRVLTWKLVNTGRTIPYQTMRKVMYIALGTWSDHANINFRESLSDDADLIVKFVRLVHEDQYSFDGRGGTLAHAFYPYPGYKIGGDIHFDNDEEFTYQKSSGTDILWVATHEAGHSLGLEHSQLRDAIMYPWYQGTRDTKFDLRRDDISGIQALYGARPKTTPKPATQKVTTQEPVTERPTTQKVATQEPVTERPTTQKVTTQEPVTERPTTQKVTTQEPVTERPTTQKVTTQEPVTERPTKKPKYGINCPAGINAAVVDDTTGWMFAFSGGNFYLVSRRGVKHGPIKVKSYFVSIKKPVTAAYVRKSDRHLIIFTGSEYHDFQGFYEVRKARPVTDFGLPANTKVDAAFYWNGNGKLYLFTGTKYYRYNERLGRIDNYYPRVISKAWRGLPSRITTAVTGFKDAGKPGPTYFVSNDKFYHFNDKKIMVNTGYPKHIKRWLLCNSNAPDPILAPQIGSLESKFEEAIDP